MLIYSISQESDLSNIPGWVEWIELRVDLASSLVKYLSDLPNYKIIITDRWRQEGGESKRNLHEKLTYYRTFGGYPNIYYDIEIALLRDNDNLPIDFSQVILSYHSFEHLKIEEIESMLFTAGKLNPLFVKIAQHCVTFSEVSELYHLIEKLENKILWVVMGKYGKLQRLLYSYLKSIGTFIVGDGGETVVGQLNISDVEKYQHLLSTKPFKWGGIIGGNQVYSSLGLDFYNNYFRTNHIDACYLPISIEESDLESFFELINSCHKLKKHCYGFSLTMPFKQIIPAMFNQATISNLLIYKLTPKFYNTDYDALVKIKEKLEHLSIKTILIYGTGSMAEVALTVFTKFTVFLTGRNRVKLQEIKDRIKNIEIIDQISPELYFDLLINTSPLGMKGESFSQETEIRKFKYVIDLPYSQSEIPLQSEVEAGKYISGREFWLYQSERQLQLFKERIEND